MPELKLKNYSILGNSLGGHIGLILALKHPKKIKRLILSGSSGLYENTLGGSFPKRGSYDYIKNKTEEVFYDPKKATKQLVDEVFDIVNNREKVLRVLMMAKSAMRHNMKKELPKRSISSSKIRLKNTFEQIFKGGGCTSRGIFNNNLYNPINIIYFFKVIL